MISRRVWTMFFATVCSLQITHAFLNWHRLSTPKVVPVHTLVRALSSYSDVTYQKTIVDKVKRSSRDINLLLCEEVGLPGIVVEKLVSKYPGLTGLSVDNNLRPTLNVFSEFGFTHEEMARLITAIPMILGHNAGFSLPEKLISLRKMYACTAPELIELAMRAPFILTTSIDKNTRIADFFRNTVQLTSEQILQLMRVYPAAATGKVDVLRRCWALLTRLYGLDETQARKVILDCPMVLSERLVDNIKDRLVFLSSEFDVQSFPCEYIKAIAMKFPSFLYLDCDSQIKPNLAILRELVSLDESCTMDTSKHKKQRSVPKKPKGWDSEHFLLDDWVVSEDNHVSTTLKIDSMQTSELGRMLLRLPNLLKYRPSDLRKICSNAMLFLTGESSFTGTLTIGTRNSANEGSDYITGGNSERVMAQYNNLIHEGSCNNAVGSVDNENIITTDSEELAYCNTHNETKETILDETTPAECGSYDLVYDWIYTRELHVDSEGRCVHDLIRDIADNYSSNTNHISISMGTSSTTSMPLYTYAMQHYTNEAAHLTLSVPRACTAVRNHPGILAYRTQRSQGVVAALTVSLGLSRAEVSKMVQTYYRLLALSVDGKLRDVLRVLAVAAVRCLAYTTLTSESSIEGEMAQHLVLQNQALHEIEPSLSAVSDTTSTGMSTTEKEIEVYRSHPVRTMVREMVMRYPQILGSSIVKITERFAWAASESAPWDAYLACWRMSDQKFYSPKRRVPKTRVRKPLHL